MIDSQNLKKTTVIKNIFFENIEKSTDLNISIFGSSLQNQKYSIISNGQLQTHWLFIITPIKKNKLKICFEPGSCKTVIAKSLPSEMITRYRDSEVRTARYRCDTFVRDTEKVDTADGDYERYSSSSASWKSSCQWHKIAVSGTQTVIFGFYTVLLP